jgi:hypothetical protein
VSDRILQKVFDNQAHSPFLHSVASVRRDGGLALALGGVRVRSLTDQEISRLAALGNFSEDWSRVSVADGFDCRFVRQSTFCGDVVLGRFGGRITVAEGVELPSGVYHSTLSDCVVGHDALVRGVGLLANVVVGARAVVRNCGNVTAAGETTFGNGASLPLGIETGGRDVAIYAEMELEAAAAVARSRSRHDFLKSYARLVAEYSDAARSNRTILETASVVSNTPTLRNCYVGPHAVIDGATLVTDSTLLSSADEPVRIESGSCVTRSLLQWGSRVSTMALVDQAVLTEHSHVERHGKLTSSILGPNTVVGQGEVTACLLGPFVGFHHQALLIAALWPEGKGNISSGANVGSNHTGKAPDQEFWPGEGAFLGLGVSIKYPADFSRAPYTLVASGVSTLPQKVTFPFSLIRSPASHHEGVSPAYNEILPAWVLSDNLYAVRRNEAKYRARNRARRTRFSLDVFRPDTVELMRDACRRLEWVSRIQEVYTDRDIEGLGKNYLEEPARQTAIAAYRFHVRHYALLGLLERIREAQDHGRDAVLRVLHIRTDNPRWEHQRHLLTDELGVGDVLTGLRQLPELLYAVAARVEQSKARDDQRGAAIIPDYADAHPKASADVFVQRTWEETRRLQAEVDHLLGCLTPTPAAELLHNGVLPSAMSFLSGQ